jgi:hypothetical protein
MVFRRGKTTHFGTHHCRLGIPRVFTRLITTTPTDALVIGV